MPSVMSESNSCRAFSFVDILVPPSDLSFIKRDWKSGFFSLPSLWASSLFPHLYAPAPRHMLGMGRQHGWSFLGITQHHGPALHWLAWVHFTA